MRRTVLALAIVVAGLGVSFGVLASGGWKVVELQGHSMEPAIAPGSLLFVREMPKSELNVGDIVLVTADSTAGTQVTVAHRIQRMIARGSRVVAFTKGDANAITDPMPTVFQQSVPRVELVLPHGQTLLRYGLSASLIVLGIAAYLAVAQRIMGIDVGELFAAGPRKLHPHGR